jgi:hypothetical protein
MLSTIPPDRSALLRKHETIGEMNTVRALDSYERALTGLSYRLDGIVNQIIEGDLLNGL